MNEALQKPFKNPSETPSQAPSETLHKPSDSLPGSGGSVAGAEMGRPWFGPSAHPGKRFAARTCNTNVPFGLVPGNQVHFFGLILGILGASGRAEGWCLVRYLCKTRKALHERHIWKTLGDKDSAELLRELSGAICLKTPVLLRDPSSWSDNSLPIFGAVQQICQKCVML